MEWKQIHTNGADTTFARVYEYRLADLTKVWKFEKITADSVNSTAEVFGHEEFRTQAEAERRLRFAVNSGA